jgi:hypothetical protein
VAGNREAAVFRRYGLSSIFFLFLLLLFPLLLGRIKGKERGKDERGWEGGFFFDYDPVFLPSHKFSWFDCTLR